MIVSVRDLASSPPTSASIEMTVSDALDAVLTTGTGELYVTDDSGLLAGVVTDYDLLKAQMNGSRESQRVEEVMSRCPACISANEPVVELVGMFREARYSQMAVVDRGHLVGIVSRRDVMRLIRSLSQLGIQLGCTDDQNTVDAANAMRGPRYMQNRKLMAERSQDLTV